MNPAHQLLNVVSKIRWGVGVVGVPACVHGCVRLLRLLVLRPASSSVTLRKSGITLAFRCPSQTVPALVVFGDLIDPEYPFLDAIGRRGGVVLDVGAAIGQFSIYSARMHGSTVHAVEPSVPNVEQLRANAERNGVAGPIEVHRVALSSTNGHRRFITEAVTYVSGLSDDDSVGEEMETLTLDSFCEREGITEVALLKVNVAGHEPDVLGGAMRLLAAGAIEIMICLVGLQTLATFERISRLGYGFYFFDPHAGVLSRVMAFDEESFFAARRSPARHVLAIRSSSDAMNRAERRFVLVEG